LASAEAGEAAEVEVAGAVAAPGPGPWRAFAPRLALWVVVLLVVGVVDPDPALSLMLVALAGVVTIVSDARFAIERRIEALGLPSREAWVPLAMLVVLFGFDLVEPDRIGPVAGEQGPVILFILAFALVSEGLGRSGFFHFLAFRLAERGGADMVRLILYLFLLSSLLAYFTSNDIVVLTMTPIVFSVCYQARIRNAKLLLLSQFVAANTVSMGLLIGSPSNLIMARAVGIGFLEYFLLMAVPSVMALMVTFSFVTWINHFVERHAVERDAPRSRLAMRLAARRRAQGPLGRSLGRVRSAMAERLVGTWKFSPVYSTPRFAEYRSFTPEMGQWIAVFGLAVLVLAFGAGSSVGLFAAAIAIATLGLTFLRRSARRSDEPTGAEFFGMTFRLLPLGIVFFGMTYFFIADAIAHQPFVQDEVEGFVADRGSTHSPVASWGSILGTGFLVNTMNDLPAAALAGEVVAGVEEDGRRDADGGFETPFDRILVAQGVQVGLNIGTYVTPVGALAGIIWFDILRKERRRRDAAAVAARRRPLHVAIPERRDLVVYGSAMFLVVGFVVGATNFGFVSLADWLAGPRSGHTGFGEAPAHTAASAVCLGVALLTVVAFFRVLRRHGVALTHLGDLLFLMTRVRLRAARHRVVTAVLIFVGIFMASATLLYNVELFHDAHYSAAGVWGGTQRPDFEGPAEFVLWLHVFITSGYEGEREFPDSVFGRLVAPVLVLGAIASVVFVVRTLLTGSSDQHVRRRIATGEIPGDRIVVVNVAMENLRLVDTLAGQPRRFVTVATHSQRVGDWLESHSTDRMAVVDYGHSTQELVLELRLHEAREIVLLSRSLADDFDNLDLLTTLDAVLGGDNGSTVGARAVAVARTSDDEEGAEPPAILLQRHGAEMRELVRSRLSSTLQASLVDLAFDDVVRRFVTANAAGHIEDLRQLYARPELDGLDGGEVPAVDPIDDLADDPDRSIRIEGLQLSLGVDDRADATHPIDSTDVVVGIEVMSTVRPDWRTFAARRALELPRQVTGTVLLGARDAHQGRYDNSSRAHVYVVGSDGLAQQCALDLASGGVEQVTLLMGTSDTLVPGFGRPGNVEVRKCASEVAAVEILLTSEARDDEAILLVESFAEGAFDTEKLLQRLSVERLHQARSDPEKVAPLYVCCRGPDRSRRIRNYVVDEIIDATWVEASYFAVFTNLYLDAMIGEEAIANWPQKQRLDVADRIAQQLCHLELVRPADLWADEPGAVDKSVLGMSGAEAVREDRAAGPARGPLVGVIRFDVEAESDDADVPVVAVRVDVPPGDERIEPDDLLVCLPCL